MVILLLQMHRNFQSGQTFRAAPCSSLLLNTERPVCTHRPGTHFRDGDLPGFPWSSPGEARGELATVLGSPSCQQPSPQLLHPENLTFYCLPGVPV